MAVSSDPVSLLLVAVGVLLAFLLLDLLVAGGGMMGGMMGGISGMMGTPQGWGALLLVVGAVALIVFGPALGMGR